MSMKTILMRRDGLTEQEAQAEVDMVREQMYEHIHAGDIGAAMDVCEMVGLEPDYLNELI